MGVVSFEGDFLVEGDLDPPVGGFLLGDFFLPGVILARWRDREDSARSMAPDSKLLGLVCVRRSFRLPVDEQRDGMGWGGAPMTRRWRGIDCCGCDGSPAGG